LHSSIAKFIVGLKSCLLDAFVIFQENILISIMFVKTSCLRNTKWKGLSFSNVFLCRHVDIYNPILHVYQRLQPTMYYEFILLASRQYANKTTLRMDAFIMYMVIVPCDAHVYCDTLSSHVKVYIYVEQIFDYWSSLMLWSIMFSLCFNTSMP
jgi:hypothetical protein